MSPESEVGRHIKSNRRSVQPVIFASIWPRAERKGRAMSRTKHGSKSLPAAPNCDREPVSEGAEASLKRIHGIIEDQAGSEEAARITAAIRRGLVRANKQIDKKGDPM